MKTHDKIKKGLECCGGVNVPCKGCPYNGDTLDYDECIKMIHKDTIAYIQLLEAEQDAAIKAIARHSSCIDCKHSTIIPDGENGIWVDCPKRDGRCRGHDLWEWRGVQKENEE